MTTAVIGATGRTAELLITREWAILAGENDYTTGTFQQIVGRPRARWPNSSTNTARNSPEGPASPSPSGSPRLGDLPRAQPLRYPCDDVGRIPDMKDQQ